MIHSPLFIALPLGYEGEWGLGGRLVVVRDKRRKCDLVAGSCTLKRSLSQTSMFSSRVSQLSHRRLSLFKVRALSLHSKCSVELRLYGAVFGSPPSVHLGSGTASRRRPFAFNRNLVLSSDNQRLCAAHTRTTLAGWRRHFGGRACRQRDPQNESLSGSTRRYGVRPCSYLPTDSCHKLMTM